MLVKIAVLEIVQLKNGGLLAVVQVLVELPALLRQPILMLYLLLPVIAKF
jgi:hypothetical protein